MISEFFSSGDVSEAVRCISEMDTCFYNHEVVKRMVSAALDHTNRERELTSQFLALAVGDGADYPIPRNSCELGFIVLLQRVEGLFKDVPDVLELLSAFIGRAMVDEVLPPAFVEHVTLLETDMGYAVIHHVKHLVSGKKRAVDDQLLNVWGANTSRSIQSIKLRISRILREYLISRELDEALTATQGHNIMACVERNRTLSQVATCTTLSQIKITMTLFYLNYCVEFETLYEQEPTPSSCRSCSA